MKIKVCSTMIHPQEMYFPSKTSSNTTYTTITPTILNDAFCDCPGFHFNGGKCSHTKIVEENKCDFFALNTENYVTIDTCPNCGAPMEDFETKSEFV